MSKETMPRFFRIVIACTVVMGAAPQAANADDAIAGAGFSAIQHTPRAPVLEARSEGDPRVPLPEPGAVVLFGIGMATLALTLRRRA